MSYSFNAKGGTKAEAVENAKVKLAEVVQTQPIHSRDQAQAQETVEKIVAVVSDPGEDEQVSLYVSGSLGWQGVLADDPSAVRITSATVNVSASIITKE